MPSSFRGSGEQEKVAVGVLDDERLCTPRLLPERLEECNPCALEFEEQPLDLLGRVDAHVGRQEALAISELGIDDGIVDALEIEDAIVPLDLGIERRLAVDEHDRKAESLREEIAGRLDISDEQLCRGRD